MKRLARLARALNLLLVVFIFPQALAQGVDLSTLQNQLSEHNIVRGEFTQLRHIDMFEQPLRSQGQFTLSKQDGLLWHQLTPFSVNLSLTKDKLRQNFAGQDPQIITAKDNPMAFYFSHIFLAVFHGDTAALTEQFDLNLEAAEELASNAWRVELTPLQAPLNAVFKSISLSGSDYIDSLTLQEVRGDKTEILFTNQTDQPEVLTDAEVLQFSF